MKEFRIFASSFLNELNGLESETLGLEIRNSCRELMNESKFLDSTTVDRLW
jgi:hypothetical protein